MKSLGSAVVSRGIRGHDDKENLSAQLGIHMNQDTVGSLSLTGVAGHGIAMVKMRMLAWVEFYRAATVHLQVQPPIFLDARTCTPQAIGISTTYKTRVAT
jgi:hypothetical protein